MVSIANYWAFTVTQFTDNRRKDFSEMFFHHIITLYLTCSSWMSNSHRVGSVILVLHDSSDVFLEIGKASKYASLKRTCNTNAGLFIVVWVTTRLIILYCLLVALLFLHFYWSYFIYKTIEKGIRYGQIQGDDRSDSEDERIECKR